MSIENINELPKNIKNFIDSNINKLIEIYDEGINKENDGLLYFKCVLEENKIDVMFLGPIQITKIIENNLWEQLKENRNNKKIFLINQKNNIFILYL